MSVGKGRGRRGQGLVYTEHSECRRGAWQEGAELRGGGAHRGIQQTEPTYGEALQVLLFQQVDGELSDLNDAVSRPVLVAHLLKVGRRVCVWACTFMYVCV